MDKTIEGADSVHRVKRGRPAKVDVVATTSEEVQSNKPVKYVDVPYGLGQAQAYAMRVWSGQSVDVPRHERIERCLNALRGQNLPTDGIEFPC